eukprot:gene30484-40505_t
MKRKNSEIIDLCSDCEENNETMCSSASLAKETFTENKWQPFYWTTVSGIDQEYNARSLSIRDIFAYTESNPITEICISNYMIDLSWTIELCPIFLAVPVLCLHGTPPDPNIRSSVNITNCKVDMGEERFGTHHSKFAIIKYLNGVRICITTANFIPEDFTYRTQGIFVQDFPTNALGKREIESRGDFESTLFEYLQALRVTSSARKILDALIHSLSTDYDFSSAEVVLIPSLPGRHSSSNPRRRNSLGIAKLSHLLKEEYSHIGDDVLKSLTLVMQFSSLGSMGKDAKLVDDYVARMLPTPANLQSSVQRNKVEIVWPTVDCVRNSLQGYSAGSSLPCAAKNLVRTGHVDNTSEGFLSGFAGRMRVWDGSPSGRSRATPHMKCYFAYNCSPPHEHSQQ